MDDGPLTPTLLAVAEQERSLAETRPLVFLNACRSSSENFEYTRSTSWARAFMRAGAGAFVGTMWAVRSTSASEYAEAFYSSLVVERRPLSEAAQFARESIRGNSADPTWLAYTVYGEPDAIAG
jgi:CHAT domain-containing protein